MPNFYGSEKLDIIPVINHRVGDRVFVISESPYQEPPKLVIRDTSTGYYFNKDSRKFEEYETSSSLDGKYSFTSNILYDTGLYNFSISTLPKERQSLLFSYKTLAFFDEDGGIASEDAVSEETAETLGTPFVVSSPGNYVIQFELEGGSTDVVYAEVTVNGEDVDYSSVEVAPPGTARSFSFQLNGLLKDDEVSIKGWALNANLELPLQPTSNDQPRVFNIKIYRLSYERHVFGGEERADAPAVCTVYGTLLDVSGKPLSGQKVEAYLNRAGYFTHKAGLVGYAATAITDESGYWELPLIIGLDVTINVPIIGFSQSGFVPPITSVELTPETLLKYRN